MDEDATVRGWVRAWSKEALSYIGDDCAVLPGSKRGFDALLKTDAVVCGRHFNQEDAPSKVGYKALGRVLSDFAAMGGQLQSVMVSIGIPKEIEPSYIRRLYRGMGRLADKYSVQLVGGETTRCSDLWVNVCGIGKVKKGRAVLRSTAGAGDRLFVTGRLGGSFPKRHLRFVPRVKEGRWLAEKRMASAMMDLSDGLGKDLPRMALASGLSYEVEPTLLPRYRGINASQAVNDGEDYELLLAVPEVKVEKLRAVWPFTTRLTEIGQMVLKTKMNKTHGLEMQGFDHFL